MKTLTKLLTVIAIAALGQSAYGVTYLYKTADYVDQYFWYPNEGNEGTQFNGTFDITASAVSDSSWDKFGYNPSTETITEVEILFALSGGLLDIKLGSASGSVDPLNSPGSSFSDFINGNAVVYNFDFGTLGGSLLMQLAQTGTLDWEIVVNAEQGQTEAVAQKLYAVSLAANVPDSGATIGLLGACLFALASIKRRMK